MGLILMEGNEAIGRGAVAADERALVIKAAGIDLPPCRADIHEIDFKAFQIKSQDRALAALAWLARKNQVLTPAMLKTALDLRFKGPVRKAVRQVVETMGA